LPAVLQTAWCAGDTLSDRQQGRSKTAPDDEETIECTQRVFCAGWSWVPEWPDS